MTRSVSSILLPFEASVAFTGEVIGPSARVNPELVFMGLLRAKQGFDRWPAEDPNVYISIFANTSMGKSACRRSSVEDMMAEPVPWEMIITLRTEGLRRQSRSCEYITAQVDLFIGSTFESSMETRSKTMPLVRLWIPVIGRQKIDDRCTR